MFSRIATVAARAPRAQIAGVSSRRTMLTAQKGLYTAKASATGGGRADGFVKSLKITPIDVFTV